MEEAGEEIEWARVISQGHPYLDIKNLLPFIVHQSEARPVAYSIRLSTDSRVW